jgi:two-component system, NtrC family, response regulator HydG
MSDDPIPILGGSRAAAGIREFARIAGGVDVPVLITGETGTGKGVLARAIHEASRRRDRALVDVNCAGVPESLFESEFFGHARGAFTGAHQTRRGLFEQANGGTLFLDEIGELTPMLQAKLLTSIESGRIRRVGAEGVVAVDARLIAATGIDLEAAVAEGRFRLDLYHRLLVLSCHLPPLRERPGDIVLLARHFICAFAAQHRRPAGDLHPSTIRLIESHPWPGNIRQLAHALEAAVITGRGGSIRPEHLPQRLLQTTSDTAAPPGRYCFYGTPAEERARIAEALRASHGNMTRAARALHMSRTTLRARMAELDIPPPAVLRRSG